jgi:hypothetical protein
MVGDLVLGGVEDKYSRVTGERNISCRQIVEIRFLGSRLELERRILTAKKQNRGDAVPDWWEETCRRQPTTPRPNVTSPRTLTLKGFTADNEPNFALA